MLTQKGLTGATSETADPGQEEYTTPGTYTWICPVGVSRVSVLCVGAGGPGGPGPGFPNYSATQPGNGGGGGALAYSNDIGVLPGQSYTVVVGEAIGYGPSYPSFAGGYSSFSRTSDNLTYVLAIGGNRGLSPGNGAGGSFSDCIGDVRRSGGNGGDGGTYAGGGGGAAGYSGNGGNGGGTTGPGTGENGTGGGAGGGGRSSFDVPGAGGGVGIYGEGSSGTGGNLGQPGNGGSAGSAGITFAGITIGGTAGGGGGGGATGIDPGFGGHGAVRIIWGANRAFPSTNTGDV